VDTGKLLGLPAHPLLVHAVVVLVPLCALGVVVCALWPAARRRLALTVLLLSVLAAALVPPATESGEWLEERVGETALVERHAELGDAFLPYAVALVVGAALVAALRWVEARGEAQRSLEEGVTASAPARRAPRWMTVVVAVVALVTSAAAGYQTYLVGHSGAASVWSGIVSGSGTGADQPAGENEGGE
jgi:predicted membrane protein DUF2231